MRKDEEFWKYIEQFDIINLSETWMEEEGWKRIKGKLPEKYSWEVQLATRVKKKGRGVGGMITGINKQLHGKALNMESSGMMTYVLELEREKWKIISVYNREDKKNLLKKITEEIDTIEGMNIIIGGDFNARTAEEGGLLWDGEEETGKRKSKDKMMNKQGEELIEEIQKHGLGILNGNTRGDEQGEWTFEGAQGRSVIDYAICNIEAWEKVGSMKIGERTDSDHMPVEIEMNITMQKEDNVVKEEEKIQIENWSVEGCRIYEENLRSRKETTGNIQEEWEELKSELHRAIPKKTITRKKYIIGQKKWWDKECRESKRHLNKSLRQMRKGWITREEHKENKKRHESLCKDKIEKEREKEQKRIMEIRDGNEIWRYIKKERGRKDWPDESIKEEQWRMHFMNLLEGREEKDKKKEAPGKERNGEEEKERIIISTDELHRAKKRLKRKKAAGEDGLKNEVWLQADDGTMGRLRRIMQSISDTGEIPEGWKEGWIHPIYKKGEKNKAENYRGITLMDTAYKLYAMVLEEKLRAEAERLKLLPETQAGFRKGRSGIENIYI